ncbi:hypothetical protein C8035_v005391 [Colletotrichum spinosum]|uniref:Uncharacterized protein n=1 Tax=Colletotrichum spinosum TaxID=1347390 RepID=A0A4R8QL06_9PEZI|nr:hypothetical protein C8035_v005391 [Colletotrichum spinosum]
MQTVDTCDLQEVWLDAPRLQGSGEQTSAKTEDNSKNWKGEWSGGGYAGGVSSRVPSVVGCGMWDEEESRDGVTNAKSRRMKKNRSGGCRVHLDNEIDARKCPQCDDHRLGQRHTEVRE